MPKAHDIGGLPTSESIDQSDHTLMDWERRVDAVRGVMGNKGHITVDELRRAIEGLGPEKYGSLSYYERWAAALEALLAEKNFLTTAEVDEKVSQLELRVT